MPTLNEYVLALTTDRRFTVESSPQLIADVKKAQAKRIVDLAKRKKLPPPTKPISRAAPYAPTKEIVIKPITLLHVIGRATTPPIPNLVELSATWTIVRYIWAFALSTSKGTANLRLSDHARRIDFHQKALLSDQMGVGFACYLMARDYQMTAPVDVDVALKQLHWSFRKQLARSPDYLFSAHPSGPTFIVECKGTQTTRAGSIWQIRSGTEQIPSIVFTDGRTSTGLIFATCLKQKETTVYVVDPPAGPNEQKVDDRTIDNPPAEWIIRNDEEFMKDVRRLASAKTLSFAGATADAASLAPRNLAEEYLQAIPRPVQETVANTHGTFKGIRETVEPSDGIRLSVYRGLQKDRHDEILDEVNAKQKDQLEQNDIANDTIASQTPGAAVTTEKTKKGIEISSVAGDGTILSITLSKS